MITNNTTNKVFCIWIKRTIIVRLVREGAFANVSTRIRVVVSDDVMLGEVPETALPFGFRGVEALLTNGNATDSSTDLFLTGVESGGNINTSRLFKSVLPPLPYRFKVTKGSIKTNASYAQTFTGQASASESVDLNLHWGLTSRRVKDIDNPNGGTYEFNELLANYLKFMGNDSDVKTSAGAKDITLSDLLENAPGVFIEILKPVARISFLAAKQTVLG